MVQLHKLLGNKKNLHLLTFFLDNPSQEFTYTETQKQTKLSKATLTKWLSFLTKEDLLTLKLIGRNKLYQLQKDSTIVKQLKILISLQKLTFLREIATKHQVEIYLYGSTARGEDNEKSDIDILIIGAITREKIFSLIEKQTKTLKRPIQFQIFTSIEWTKCATADRAFYERVEKDKIKLQ
ncbi:hypothetical protein A2642_00590 [Candidatus Nomurabacteria bacterium RIFCSPHIGHO2_01_FULL_39_10]|uniref:Polymerase nucleotidyl transferase domain-containing protein n=1 Tax=Candidatus Nomurabacteria bacterium RIFCSPHIGHO2_01_FULL_39_10 TaxID=1801733 RepID=A0A1F6V5I0_9BACT|nr:MAG: hypothetical protein A2642_00590 [Candidatus Nomurabacteria bacterium RIFCSPHIGHO2_01_FULL_39_10]